jgi:hypothetical protein
VVGVVVAGILSKLRRVGGSEETVGPHLRFTRVDRGPLLLAEYHARRIIPNKVLKITITLM